MLLLGLSMLSLNNVYSQTPTEPIYMQPINRL